MDSHQPFKARAHLLKLLGDELIGDDRLAIFELVKNSYDACASHVEVELLIEKGIARQITVKDDGVGMTRETIENVWLEIGTPHKRGENRKRIKPCDRMPLGEKGVGRLAAHKLGTKIFMATKSKTEQGKEHYVRINWPSLIKEAEYIENTKVRIKTGNTKLCKGISEGTYIKITDLHRKSWDRRDIRSLKRMISTLVTPFEANDSFDVTLSVPGREDWLKDLFEVGDIIDRAVWKFEFDIDEEAKFRWSYNFNPPAFKDVSGRVESNKNDCLELLRPDSTHSRRKKDEEDNLYLVPGDLKGIGPIAGSIYVFDRRPSIIRKLGNTKQIKDYLDEQTGVRVYRDGVRVYNYGEPFDDWLGLNAGRINRPAEKMGTNSVISAISLDLEKSHDLREKTNREGFDENDSFLFFRRIIRSVVAFLDVKRLPDRKELDKALKDKKTSSEEEDFSAAVNKLKKDIKKNNLDKELYPHIEVIEKEYEKLQEVMVSSGVSGLGLAVIFHEVEREVSGLQKAVSLNQPVDDLKDRVSHLVSLLDGFSPLLKKSEQRTVLISKVIDRVKAIHQQRFSHHNISFSCPVLTGEAPDFQVTGAVNLILGAISNIVDNAIYWSRRKSERPNEANPTPLIYVTTFIDSVHGPSLVVSDNGPGFEMPLDEAIRPFSSDRIGGMGLGLYYASLIMEMQNGLLEVVDPEDLDLPASVTGAAVVLTFKGK